jgi:hypothetical protein
VLLDRAGDAEIGDAGLGRHRAVGKVDVEDAGKARHDEQHRIGQRQRAAGERGARAARHNFDVFALAIFEDSGDLRRCLWKNDDHGHLTVGGEAVAFENAHASLSVDNPLPRHDLAQLRDDFRALGERGGVGGGHDKRGHLSKPSAPAMATGRGEVSGFHRFASMPLLFHNS